MEFVLALFLVAGCRWCLIPHNTCGANLAIHQPLNKPELSAWVQPQSAGWASSRSVLRQSRGACQDIPAGFMVLLTIAWVARAQRLPWKAMQWSFPQPGFLASTLSYSNTSQAISSLTWRMAPEERRGESFVPGLLVQDWVWCKGLKVWYKWHLPGAQVRRGEHESKLRANCCFSSQDIHSSA